MPSTILRRVFGENSVFGQRSIYDDLNDHDADEEALLRDLEEQAGMISGGYDENFGTAPTNTTSPYGGYRDDPTTATTTTPQTGGIQLHDRTASASRAPALMNSTYQSYLQENRRPNRGMGQSRANNFFSTNRTTSVEADEVPASLLMEGGAGATDGYARDRYNAARGTGYDTRQMQVPPTNYGEERRGRTDEENRRARLGLIDPKERAMWKWANVQNLDNFLLEVC
jgi:autophagy-related protein 9